MLTVLAHRLALTLPPMLAHRLAVRAVALGWPAGRRSGGGAPVTVAGVQFANPLGLAAGFDKDGVALVGLARMGFGHVEIGTVTPRPQAGIPGRPLLRLKADRAIINRLGMPSDGADVVVVRLAAWREANPRHPMRIGVSIGANRDSTDIAADLALGVRRFGPLADYLAVNLSSPNTLGLRDWQRGDRLAHVLDAVGAARAGLIGRPPVFVKIAPDMTAAEEADLVDRAIAAGIDGLILCNTTTARPPHMSAAHRALAGGLSGAPVTDRALAQLKRVRARAGGRLALIASGGVMTAEDAVDRIEAGASLVQVYTGWVFGGPRLVDEILSNLAGESRGVVTAGSGRSLSRLRPGPARS